MTKGCQMMNTTCLEVRDGLWMAGRLLVDKKLGERVHGKVV